MEAEAVEAVFADIEGQRADHDPEQRERKGAGQESDNERREPEREPDIGAMAQESEDHRRLQTRFSPAVPPLGAPQYNSKISDASAELGRSGRIYCQKSLPLNLLQFLGDPVLVVYPICVLEQAGDTAAADVGHLSKPVRSVRATGPNSG
jgi:hypothetical protein